MLHNGGHNDYHGNEVYSCDLGAASPEWIRRRSPSTPSGSGNITKFADGRPCSDHTTNMNVAAEGRWFTPGMASTNYYGYANYQQWWEYDPVADDYINLGSSHASNGNAVAGCVLWDAVDRQMLVIHDNNSPSIEYQDLDDMSGAPALLNNNSLGFGGATTGSIDTLRRILLVRHQSTYRWIKLVNDATKSGPWNTLSASGSAPVHTSQLHWHEPSQAFLSWNGGSSLYKLTPTVDGGGNYTSLNWSSVSASGGPTPMLDTSMQGMYNKIQLLPDMGDGTAAMILVPRWGNPDVYVMRLTGGV